MNHGELRALIGVLPVGEWVTRTSSVEHGKLALVAAQSGEVLAERVRPEIASFLVEAQRLLPTLLEALEREQLYGAVIAGRNVELAQHVAEVETQLQCHQIEAYTDKLEHTRALFPVEAFESELPVHRISLPI